jgi:hypothetical protein
MASVYSARSVAMTLPLGATISASQNATAPPPAPISIQRAPGPTTKALKMRPGSFVERVFESANTDPLLGPGVVVRVPTVRASPRYRVEISPGRLKR